MTEENKAPSQALEIITPSALESLERANVDVQISTARRYPRSITVAKGKMTELATLDEETAMSCFYVLKRGAKEIEGPSVRMAEIAACAFGNLRFGARVVANDGRFITAQGFCHDLENNVLSTMEVKRRITDKDGRTYSDDMQTVTGNAACAIAARNAIFKVVPFALIKPVYLAAKQAAIGDITTLAKRRTQMLAKFGGLGVDEKRLCHAVGKAGIEEIGLSEMATLVGIYNAIRENEQTVEEAFPEVEGAPKAKATKPGANGSATAASTADEAPFVPDWRVVVPHFGRHKKPLGKLKPETLAYFQNLDGKGWPGPKADANGKISDQDRMFAAAVELSKQGPPKEKTETPATPLPPAAKLRTLMESDGIVEKDLIVYLFSQRMIEQGETLEKMADAKIEEIIKSWPSIAEQVKEG